MKNLINTILLLLIAVTPINNLVETMSKFGVEITIDISYLKLIKDVLLILLLVITAFYSVLRNSIQKSILLPFVVMLTFTALCFVLNLDNLYTSLAGLRWSLPFFITLLLVGIIDEKIIRRITVLLSVLITLNFLLQFYQMFNMPAYGGSNILGFSGRLTGFFVHPSAAGVFTCFAYFAIRFFSSFSPKWKKVLLILSVVSVFLTMSSTGVGLILVLILMPMYFNTKSQYRFLLALVVVPLLFVAVLNLDLLTGRAEGSSSMSFGTRMEIFFNSIGSSEFVSTQFGSATNTIMSLSEFASLNDKNAFISDSLFTSFLSNYGYLFFLIFIVALVIIAIKVFFQKDLPQKLLFLMFVLSSLAIITTEIFPVNILFSVFAAYFFNIRRLSYSLSVAKLNELRSVKSELKKANL